MVRMPAATPWMVRRIRSSHSSASGVASPAAPRSRPINRYAADSGSQTGCTGRWSLATKARRPTVAAGRRLQHRRAEGRWYSLTTSPANGGRSVGLAGKPEVTSGNGEVRLQPAPTRRYPPRPEERPVAIHVHQFAAAYGLRLNAGRGNFRHGGHAEAVPRRPPAAELGPGEDPGMATGRSASHRPCAGPDANRSAVVRSRRWASPRERSPRSPAVG